MLSSFDNYTEKEDKRLKFGRHHEVKNQLRNLTNNDKMRAQIYSEFSSAVFDLGDVFITLKAHQLHSARHRQMRRADFGTTLEF